MLLHLHHRELIIITVLTVHKKSLLQRAKLSKDRKCDGLDNDDDDNDANGDDNRDVDDDNDVDDYMTITTITMTMPITMAMVMMMAKLRGETRCSSSSPPFPTFLSRLLNCSAVFPPIAEK